MFLKVKDTTGRDLVLNTDSVSYFLSAKISGKDCYTVMFDNGYGKDISRETAEEVFKAIKAARSVG